MICNTIRFMYISIGTVMLGWRMPYYTEMVGSSPPSIVFNLVINDYIKCLICGHESKPHTSV